MTDREWRIFMLEDTVGRQEAIGRVDARLGYTPHTEAGKVDTDNDDLGFFAGAYEAGQADTLGGELVVGDEAFIAASELAYGPGHIAVAGEVELSTPAAA